MSLRSSQQRSFRLLIATANSSVEIEVQEGAVKHTFRAVGVTNYVTTIRRAHREGVGRMSRPDNQDFAGARDDRLV